MYMVFGYLLFLVANHIISHGELAHAMRLAASGCSQDASAIQLAAALPALPDQPLEALL